jgi:hypothetical protein
MNGRNPAPSVHDFDPLDDTEDLPTGVTNLLAKVPPETRPVAEIVYREHRWNHRILRDLNHTLRAVKTLLYLVPVLAGVGAAVVEFLRWAMAHVKW